MRILCVLLIAVSIGGCTRTVYLDRVVEVKIPVPVTCVQEGDIPSAMSYATADLTSDSSDGDIILALFFEIQQRRSVEQMLRGLLSGCRG